MLIIEYVKPPGPLSSLMDAELNAEQVKTSEESAIEIIMDLTQNGHIITSVKEYKMKHYRVSNISIEDAESMAAAFEETRHGAAFSRQLKAARAGLDTIGANDVTYIKNCIESGRDLWDIIGGIYSLGYQRGMKNPGK